MKTWIKAYHQFLAINPPQICIDDEEFAECSKLFKVLTASVNLSASTFRYSGNLSYTQKELDDVLSALHRFHSASAELLYFFQILYNHTLSLEQNKEAQSISIDDILLANKVQNQLEEKQ